MSCYLQVLGSGSAPSCVPASLLLFLAHTRMLFAGAGDGTQRMATEAHVRLAKLSHVFLTRISSDTCGGLTGLLITLADLGLKRVGVHGPGPLRQFLQAARHVSVRSGMTIDAGEVPSAEQENDDDAPLFEDAHVKVQVVIIAKQRVYLPPIRSHTGWHQPQAAAALPQASAASSSCAVEPVDSSIDDTAVAPSVEPAAKKAKHHHHVPNNHSHASASSTAAAASSSAAVTGSSTNANVAIAAPRSLNYECVNTVRENARQEAEWTHSIQPSLVSYIVTLAPTPGKFDLARAKALGIPPGPLYAKLKAGESITIKASEMIGAPGVGARKKPVQKNQKPVAAVAAEPVAAPAAVPSADDPVHTIHPSDCVAATIPGPVFAVVDCPNHAFLDTLTTHRAWAKFKPATATSSVTTSTPAPSIQLMVHLTPLSLLSHPSYVAWLGSFGPSTQHLLVNASTSIERPVFRAAALNYLMLQRYVNRDLFPARIPVEHDGALEGKKDDHGSRDLKEHIASLFPAPLKVEVGTPLVRFHLLPPQNQALDHAFSVPPLAYPSAVEKQLGESSNPALIARLEKWRAAMEKDASTRGVQAVAEELRQSMDEEDKLAATSQGVADASSLSSIAPVVPTPLPDAIVLTPPPVGPFIPAPDILARLTAQPLSISPELVFLGTGSAIPSKYRNVTGQFFHPGYEMASQAHLPTHPVGGMFMDCGEGSLGQLTLRYADASSSSASSAHSIVSNLVADLKCVWVSHIHADHHLGLLAILSRYKQTWIQRYRSRHGSSSSSSAVDLRKMELVSPLSFPSNENVASSHLVPRLLVIGPRRLYFWLKEYAACAFQVEEEDQIDEVFPVASTVAAGPTAMSDDASSSSSSAAQVPPRTLWDWIEFVGCSEIQDRSNRLIPFFASHSPSLAALYPAVKPRTLAVVHTVQVRHCNDAWGLVVEALDSAAASSAAAAPSLPPYKLVISGDTQPCQALVDAGADATLLVHEATLEDDMLQEARDKRHSTTKQAVDVGLAMRAARILLTHFSQRYPKLPNSLSARSADSPAAKLVCLAFDLMVVRFAHLQWIPSLTPAFGWMFSDDELAKYHDYSKDKDEEGHVD